MKRVANGKKPIVIEPPALKPVEVEVASVGIAPKSQNAADANAVPPDGTQSDDGKLLLDVGMLFAEGEQFGEGGGTQAGLVQFLKGIVGLYHLVEVVELGFQLYRIHAGTGEVVSGDVAVDPVVIALGDGFGEGEGVVDDNLEKVLRPHHLGEHVDDFTHRHFTLVRDERVNLLVCDTPLAERADEFVREARDPTSSAHD